ncbi:MAG: hypothetical protein PHT13_05890 [Methanosarcina sp.]|nr:hypothetical protein [Methanosarcina sp.]
MFLHTLSLAEYNLWGVEEWDIRILRNYSGPGWSNSKPVELKVLTFKSCRLDIKENSLACVEPGWARVPGS